MLRGIDSASFAQDEVGAEHRAEEVWQLILDCGLQSEDQSLSTKPS